MNAKDYLKPAYFGPRNPRLEALLRAQKASERAKLKRQARAILANSGLLNHLTVEWKDDKVN